MLQPGGELDLALEPLDVDSGAGLGRQHLDDDLPAQPGLLGQEDAAHAAAAQLLDDAVGVAEGGLEALLEIGHGQAHVAARGTSPRPPAEPDIRCGWKANTMTSSRGRGVRWVIACKTNRRGEAT